MRAVRCRRDQPTSRATSPIRQRRRRPTINRQAEPVRAAGAGGRRGPVRRFQSTGRPRPRRSTPTGPGRVGRAARPPRPTTSSSSSTSPVSSLAGTPNIARAASGCTASWMPRCSGGRRVRDRRGAAARRRVCSPPTGIRNVPARHLDPAGTSIGSARTARTPGSARGSAGRGGRRASAASGSRTSRARPPGGGRSGQPDERLVPPARDPDLTVAPARAATVSCSPASWAMERREAWSAAVRGIWCRLIRLRPRGPHHGLRIPRSFRRDPGPRAAASRTCCARRRSAAHCCSPPRSSPWSGPTRPGRTATSRCSTSRSGPQLLHLNLTLEHLGRGRPAGHLLLRGRAGAQAGVRRRRPAGPAARGGAGRRRGRRHDRARPGLPRDRRRAPVQRDGRSRPPPTSPSRWPFSR